MGSPIDNWSAYFYDNFKYPGSEYVFDCNGYVCAMRRISTYYWSGYIYMPEDHPDYHETMINISMIYDPHMGISSFDDGWIGFLIGYVGDWNPINNSSPKTKYRTFAYVKGQIQKVADKMLERDIE